MIPYMMLHQKEVKKARVRQIAGIWTRNYTPEDYIAVN